MVRTNQGGSILGFVIVGGVLALLLIGGAYFVRHNLASSDRSSGPTTQQDEADSDEDSENGVGGPEASEQPDDTETSQDSDQSADDGVDNDTSEQPEEDSLPVTGNTDDEPTPGALPQTGPSSLIASSVMLGVLAALAVRYRRSRSLLTSL